MPKYNHATRKNVRSVVDQTVWIVGDDNKILASCVMADVSAGGAKLVLKSTEGIPDLFVLVLSRDGRVRRHCKVAWRDAKRIGVQFQATPAKSR